MSQNTESLLLVGDVNHMAGRCTGNKVDEDVEKLEDNASVFTKQTVS